MVHNAMSATENGFPIAANHIDDPLIESLDAGYRGLNLDLCNCDGSLQFCHGGDIVGCGLGRVDPLQTFTDINDWITTNPNNVIMISLQINEDAGGAISLDMVQSLLQQVPNGFSDRLYDHWPIGLEWPTLGELIESNQQVMFFYFQGPEGMGDHVSGLNYWYDSVIATDYQWGSVSELESTLLASCPMTRGLSSTQDFVHVEAHVTEDSFFGTAFLPSLEAAQVINTEEWAGPILDACTEFLGHPANIISVDFWSEGNLPDLMTQRNSLLVGSTPTNSPSSPITTSSPSPAPSVGSTRMVTTASSPTPTDRTPSPTSTPSLRPMSSPTFEPSVRATTVSPTSERDVTGRPAIPVVWRPDPSVDAANIDAAEELKLASSGNAVGFFTLLTFGAALIQVATMI